MNLLERVKDLTQQCDTALHEKSRLRESGLPPHSAERLRLSAAAKLQYWVIECVED